VARLDAAGLLVHLPPDPSLPTGDELAALEAEHEAWLERERPDLRLSEAILEEREESQRRLG
jgi:hypothetical protein